MIKNKISVPLKPQSNDENQNSAAFTLAKCDYFWYNKEKEELWIEEYGKMGTRQQERSSNNGH